MNNNNYNSHNLNIIDVFAVYGDDCNIGKGTLIGIFERANDASKATIGRGSIESAGVCDGESRHNGIVINKKAIKVGEEVYLLELDHAVKINQIVRPYPKNFNEQPDFGIVVIEIKNTIEFMKVVRKRTGMDLIEVKHVVDNYHKNGKAKIEPFHNNIDSTVSKEEFIQWKQEFELNNYAKIEAI